MNPRAKNPFVLQPRDLLILRDLFESRVMTIAHIATIHFEGKPQAAKKRLQKLKAAGLIAERERRVNEPSVLFLAAKAFKLLGDEGILVEFPQLNRNALERRSRVSELTLRHELEVMDVKAAFHSALRTKSDFKIAEFGTWPLLYQFEALRSGYTGAEVLVKPDGFIRIHEQETGGGVSEHAFFLELDRSTEILDTLVARAGSYLDYYKSGGFAMKNGAARDQYKEYPFRVLIVFKSAERRNYVAESLLQSNPPIYTQVCLSTLEDVRHDALGAIWIQPRDYRDATAGTPFDTAIVRPKYGYARRSERMAFVEAKAMKRSLFENPHT